MRPHVDQSAYQNYIDRVRIDVVWAHVQLTPALFACIATHLRRTEL